MANTVLLKRSSTPAKTPLVSDLSLGELAVNTYDGKVYFKKNDGLESIVRLANASELGSINESVATYSTTQALDGSYRNILLNASATGFSVTLPSASTVSGKFYIKKIDSSANIITIVGTIDSSSNYLLEYEGEFVILLSDGANWQVIGE